MAVGKRPITWFWVSSPLTCGSGSGRFDWTVQARKLSLLVSAGPSGTAAWEGAGQREVCRILSC